MLKLISAIWIFLFLNQSVLANPSESRSDSSDYSGRQSDEWIKVEADLAAFKTKLDAQEAVVQNLVQIKSKTETVTKAQTDEMRKQYTKYKDMVREYDQKLTQYEQRFPEKGQNEPRNYQRIKYQDVEKIGAALTLDGRIKKINKKIKKQYQVDEKTVTKTKPVKSVQSETILPEDNVKKTPSVTDKIILVK